MNQNDKIVLDLLEQLNEELLNYQNRLRERPNRLKFLVNAIKTNNLTYLFKRLVKKYKKKKNNYVAKNKSEVYSITNDSTLKIAVYTCITGNYDEICEPLVKESNCNYFLFTNNDNLTSKNWQIIKIPSEIQKFNNNILINRYIKMHPHELFKDYDYAIYVDGNITIVSNISCFCERVSSKTGLAMHKHYSKDCLYEEMKVCQIVGKGNPFKIKKQCKIYKKKGFPSKFGLFECNVIVSKTNNNQGKKILDAWWEEYINSMSLRDQISLPFVLWKNGYTFNDIGIIADNVFSNKKIRIKAHVK